MTANNLVKGFALLCVAITSVFIMVTVDRYTDLLASPDWCDRAIGATKDAAIKGAVTVTRPEYAVGGCFSLLNAQLKALALNSHIALGVIAICLLVLIVIVVAGGHLSFKLPGGAGADMGKNAAVAGAQAATDAAQETTNEIAATTKAAPKAGVGPGQTP